MQTVIPAGDPLARKVFGAAAFAEVTRVKSLSNRMTGPAPQESQARAALEKAQTDAAFPFIRITDLSKGRGDKVTVDMFNILQGKPTTGDKKLSGNMMKLSFDTAEITVDQLRGGVDAGGRMSQHRTIYNLRTIGRSNLVGWWARFLDQWKLVHAAGARGSMNTMDWVVPLDTDADFASIMGNPVLAPTASTNIAKNRHFIAGAQANLAAITVNDYLTLEEIDRVRALQDEADHPLQRIIMPGDGDEEGIYILLVSSRQWHHLITRAAGTGLDLRNFQQQARERAASNPLWQGEVGHWNGVMVKKMGTRRISFPSGVAMTVDDPATAKYSEIPDTPAEDVDRAILLGAQGVAECWGKDSGTGTHMRWWEEVTDHGNTYEGSLASIAGCSKIRFEDSDGFDFDYGVAALDTYAPDPNS